MKKFLIILGIIIILVVGGIILVNINQSQQAKENSAVGKDQPTSEKPTIKPWEITIGLYDPAPEPNRLTKLLESRLKELGFKTVILNELVDPDAALQEKTTLLFRTNTQEALAVVIKEVINSNLYRKGQNEAILQDVIISAWNIDDINWGSFAELADKYDNPDPAEVTVLVINAGAESGKAGELAELIKKEGYNQAKAKSIEEGEEEATRPALIYYQRNYKNVAKNLCQFLAGRGYPDISYRIQLEQQANIVIILGPKDAALEP